MGDSQYQIINKSEISEQIIKYLEDRGYKTKQKAFSSDLRFITGQSPSGNCITLRVSLTHGDLYGAFEENIDG